MRLLFIVLTCLVLSGCATNKLNNQLKELDALYESGQIDKDIYMMKYQLIYNNIQTRRSNLATALSNAGNNISSNDSNYYTQMPQQQPQKSPTHARPDGFGGYYLD